MYIILFTLKKNVYKLMVTGERDKMEFYFLLGNAQTQTMNKLSNGSQIF